MKNKLPTAIKTVEKIGKSISKDHSTFGKHLKETAGSAK
jgi:hypothetical protein